MPVKYSPENCAECGEPFTREIITDGGSSPATVTIRGHVIEVPGLWVDTGCAALLAAGVMESGLTWQAARDYLDNVYGPVMLAAGLSGQLDGEEAELAVRQIVAAMEVQTLLEAVLELQAAGELDSLPECDGKCGSRHEPHPSEVAHLN